MKINPLFIWIYLPFLIVQISCNTQNQELKVQVYQSSEKGDKLKLIKATSVEEVSATIRVLPEERYQSITGFGGAFTQSSAYLLNQLSPDNRRKILEAYFGEEGARYSLCRNHMNSCDFSVNSYSYATVAGDTLLQNFSIEVDKDDIIPMIKEAQAISNQGFKIVASPWTAPPWMKDNQDWFGGKLLHEYYDTWALFFAKYARAYEAEGIPIWAFTIENEPLGNDSHWESMHYTPQEMADFVKNHLAPKLKKEGIKSHLLVYDQNRGEELIEWADALLTDKELLPHIYGTAVHWYTGTEDWFPESLQHTHQLAPNKAIIHTEGCIDAEVPHWQDDAWYWKKEATDWGYDWAKEENKHKHPKYVPTYRYARDIIGCLNNWVEGWIDWNMVLDDQGGPNHAKNWCIAPILVKPDLDEVYITPLYYILSHFSRFIRPGAVRIGFESNNNELLMTAVQNPDKSIVLVVLNTQEKATIFDVDYLGKKTTSTIAPQAIQTLILSE